MTLDLDAIRARCEATTPGPWNNDELPMIVVDERHNPATVAITTCGADAAFIAHARADIPALLAEVERLRAVVDKLPVDANGNPVAHMDSLCFWVDGEGYVCRPDDIRAVRVHLIETFASGSRTVAKGSEYPNGTDVSNCYSTLAAAQAAKEQDNG